MDRFWTPESSLINRNESLRKKLKNQQQRINFLNSLENELKTLQTELKNSTEQSEILKQKMENQRAELKNLYKKNTKIPLLNAEIEKLKSQLDEKKHSISDADLELNASKTQQLEKEIKGHGEILNDLELFKISNQECAICCEIFSKDRKRVAYGPCGHSMACLECSETMLQEKSRKTAANIVRGRKNAECPICRAEIKTTIVLQGVY